VIRIYNATVLTVITAPQQIKVS